MKELIIQALNAAILLLEKRIPLTKIRVEYIDISDVNPLDLIKFMKTNNIPDNAYFSGRDNGDDGYSDICLCWDINILTTDNEQLKFKRDKFSNIAFTFVYDSLTKNGYKRVGFNTGLLKEFNDTTVYDMFVNKDFDRLVKYYLLSFKENS